MNENILKITIGNISIELQGESDFVNSLFNDIRDNGFGKINIQSSSTLNEQVLTESIVSCDELDHLEIGKQDKIQTNQSLPNIKDLVLKDSFSTEADWILVYGFYASEDGKESFTADGIKQYYRDTNRFTSARNKNFYTNLKKLVKNNCFSYLNEKDLIVTPTGIEKAKQLIFEPQETKKRKRTSGAKSYTEKSFNMIELGLTQSQKLSIKDLFAKYPKLSNIDKMIVIAQVLSNFSVAEEINSDYAYTVLKIAGITTSFDIVSALNNAKNKNYFSVGNEKGMYKITSFGKDKYEELVNAK